MLRALEELGISRQISVISGTSIGAFNALAYAVGGTEKMRDIMTHFFACYERGMDNDEATLARAKENVLAGRTGMEEFISDPAYRCSDSAPLAEHMRASLPDALLADYKLRVLACAYSLEDARPQYFTLNGLPGEEQRQLVLASGSLAFVYPPIAYGGRHYLDGGEIPERYRSDPSQTRGLTPSSSASSSRRTPWTRPLCRPAPAIMSFAPAFRWRPIPARARWTSRRKSSPRMRRSATPTRCATSRSTRFEVETYVSTPPWAARRPRG